MSTYSAKRISSPAGGTTVRTQMRPGESSFATLQGLKDRTYRTWKSLHQIHDLTSRNATPTTDETFKQTIRQFGDLRKKITWENAWCALYAQVIAETTDDNIRLIQGTFITCAQTEGWTHLMPQVLDNFLEDEDAKTCIQNGLDLIFQKHHGFPQDLAPFAQALASNPRFQKASVSTLTLTPAA
ncbi:hypothetical protein ACQ4M3_13145 [Leptolyngbya sp. AN03gr2]|uniref:hypothetical protein n=1 Tax=unclassified Leptolyngbya TaxID=2650499 RepID=UPI003D30F88B